MTIDAPPQCRSDRTARSGDNALPCTPMDEIAAPVDRFEVCGEPSGLEDTLPGMAEAMLNRASRKVDFARLENEILKRHRKALGMRASDFESKGARRWRFRFMAPAVAMAAMILGVVSIPNEWMGREVEPSAIVQSFSGDVDEVMIMETPVLKQTVIWYQEPAEDATPIMDNTDGGVQSS